MRLTTVVVLALAASACQDAGPNQSVVRTDSAGVEIVTSSGTDVPLTWTYRPLLTTGGEEEGPASFHRVRRDLVDADADGNLYVLDSGAFRVVSFDSAGRFRWSAGREGGGPGELRFPNSLTVGPDGTVLVHDANKAALLRFGSDGAYLGESPLPFPLIRAWQAVARPWGDALAVLSREPYQGSDQRRMALLRAGPRDTLTLLTRGTALSRTAAYPGCGMSLSLPVLFAPQFHWDTRHGSLAAAPDPEYVVTVFTDSATRSIRRAIEPHPVSEGEALAVLGERALGGPVAPCRATPEEVLRNHGYAPVAQLVARVINTPGGGLWVARRQAARSAEVRIDVFDAAGGYVGTLPEGTPFPVVFLGERRIGYVDRDEDDVERLVVAELQT